MKTSFLSNRHWRKWHRIVGTAVAIQLFIWLITGLYFNLTPKEYVTGTARLTPQQERVLDINTSSMLDPLQILFQYPNTEKIALISLAKQPYFLLTHKQKRYQHQCQEQTLISTRTYQPFVIDASTVASIALQSYAGSEPIISVKRLLSKPSELPKECNELWRVDFSDELNTRVYIRANNGEVVGHKNAYTEIADWMLRLHFLDFMNKGSFNNVFAWLFAAMTLMLVITGIITIYLNILNGRYR